MSSLPLAPYRVVDLAGEAGALCGRMLADLGADVVKVEPRGGDPLRWQAPFYADTPDPEHSLAWWVYQYNKRGVTLDFELESDRAHLRDLIRTADFVVESFAPGE